MKQHFATLDGLRGLAALFVFVFHALDPFHLSYLTPHAQLGVDFFFLLSGFVVAHAYEARLKSDMSVRSFAVVRLIRLYPLVVLGLSFGLLVFAAKLHLDAGTEIGFRTVLALICGLTFLPTPFDIAPGWHSVAPLNPPSWSLIFEFWVNILYAALVRYLTKTALFIVVIASGVLLIYQAHGLGFVNGGDRWAWIAFGPGRVAFPFFCGVLLHRFRPVRLDHRLQASPLLFALFTLTLFTPAGPENLWLYESVAVLVVFPTIIWIGAHDEPGPRMQAFFLLAGRLSYPLYILHYPFVRIFNTIAKALGPEGPVLALVLAVEIITVIVVSYGVMKLFDEPVRRRLTQAWRALRRQAPKGRPLGV